MKALFLMSQIPFPPDAGAKIRTFNLIKRLSIHHDIDLIAFGDQKIELSKIKAMKEFCKEVILIPKNRFNRIRLFSNLFSFYPYTIKKYYSNKMKKTVQTMTGQSRFDLIHCDSLQMSLNVVSLSGVPKILTEHNIESRILQRYAQTEKNPFKKIYIYLQWKKLAHYEFTVCKEFDHCITVSEQDKQYLARFMPAEKISVVPNGVDTEYFKSQEHKVTRSQEEDAMVFTGSMDWLPNEDALCYFFSEIYPLIKRDVRQVSMSVVGRSPSKRILTYAENDSTIRIVGRVEDVRPFVAQADIFVVPLRIGGGTRLKILEAMAMAKPVVSTTIGAEGLDVEAEKNIVLADTPEDFAQRVINLFSDDKLKDRVAAEGRKLVEEKYDWDMIAEGLDRIWKTQDR